MVRAAVAGAVAETMSWFGEKPHVAPDGRPLQLREIMPVKELAGAMLMVRVADDPTATVATWEDALRLNVGVEEAVEELAMTPNKPCCSASIPAVK